MGIVHDLIETQGKQAALLAESDRRAVEAAACYLADEDTGIGFLYQGGVRPPCPINVSPTTKNGRFVLIM